MCVCMCVSLRPPHTGGIRSLHRIGVHQNAMSALWSIDGLDAAALTHGSHTPTPQVHGASVQLGSHLFVYIDPEEAEARRQRAGRGRAGGGGEVDRSTEDVEWVSQWEQLTRRNARAHWRRRSEALAAAAAGTDGAGAQALPDWWTSQRRSMRHKLSRLLQVRAAGAYPISPLAWCHGACGRVDAWGWRGAWCCELPTLPLWRQPPCDPCTVER
jgi:hypothetical protein